MNRRIEHLGTEQVRIQLGTTDNCDDQVGRRGEMFHDRVLSKAEETRATKWVFEEEYSFNENKDGRKDRIGCAKQRVLARIKVPRRKADSKLLCNVAQCRKASSR